MIYRDGSKLVTRKPGADENSHVEEVEGENDNSNERTPRQRNIKKKMADTGDSLEGPYETPVVLRTKPWAPSVVPDDDSDDSEIERMVRKLRKKKVTRVRKTT
jgi:hypothetical protein